MPQDIQQESLMVPVGGKAQLHLRHIWRSDARDGEPVLMLHGAAEDGHIFYSRSGRGLACFLAREGFDVYVADLRGKGKSWPAINQHSEFGFHELVTEDIPALAATVHRLGGGQGQTWVTHSLGGALAAACLARQGIEARQVRQLVHFAGRRMVCAGGLKRRVLFDLLWQRVGGIAVAFQGYLPADSLGLGTMRESARCFRDGVNWSTREQWIDSEDGFDYSAVLKKRPWIRSLYFASLADSAFGNPDDVRDFMCELGRHDGRMLVLSRAGGNLRDYSHTGILLHPDAESDHFPQLLAWLRENPG